MRDGVHSGDVTIDKSITLLGYGDTSTVLTGPGDAGSGIAVVADGVTIEGIGVTGYRYGIFVDTAISDLTLDGISASGNGGGTWAAEPAGHWVAGTGRSEEHTSELQSLMRISYAVFCLKKKQRQDKTQQQK